MFSFVLRRLVMLVPVLFGVSVLVFMMLHLTPGDPARLVAGPEATPEQVDEIRHVLGLDQPLYRQYYDYMVRLAHGDLGRSIITHDAVTAELAPRFVATAELSGAAMLVALIIGMTFGVVSATRQYSIVDNVLSVLSLVGLSTPAYWLGLMLILLFSLHFRWFPAAGTGGIKHLILPTVTLAMFAMATVARMTRGSLLDVLNQDYVQAARAKGLGEVVVLLRHAMKNALIPIITVVGLQVGQLLSGAVLTETVFSWPGIGRFMVDSIQARDFPIVQGGVLLTATIFVIVNLVVDILYGLIDPRIRYA